MRENLTDTELLERLTQSDETAFSHIYKKYWDKLFYKAAKKLADLRIAEELVQDIFMDLWKRRETLQVSGELNHYLSAAMKYKIIRQQTSWKKERELLLSSGVAGTEQINNTEEWLRFDELQKRLMKLVKALPEKCRIAYELRDQGLTQKQIARHMNVSEKTVDTHILRALKSLRKGLGLFISNLFSLFVSLYSLLGSLI